MMDKPAKQPWVELPINPADPRIMHVDMNSCFASMEQQANPFLRGRPVGVAAYAAPYGCVISPSYEAKAQGVKTGMRVRDAQALCPDITIIQSYPPLYRDAHLRFKKIFDSYTDKVTPKSIDEAVLDFRDDGLLKGQSMEDIGRSIKKRVHEEIGEWVCVNVGIATNRFLAKTAANLHKPDGMDVITSMNLETTYATMALLDITGINHRYQARLNLNNIFTPSDFFAAPLWKLKGPVFQSIVGYYWYIKLRGWEIEDFDSKRQTIGHSYALQERTNNADLLAKLFMKLCEKTGRRLRRNHYAAGGLHLWIAYEDGDSWHHGERTSTRLYTTATIYYYTMKLFRMQPSPKVVSKIGVSVYHLIPYQPEQLGLFDEAQGNLDALSRSLDRVNDRYGELVVGSALLSGMKGFMLDRISFGGTKDIQDLYEVAEAAEEDVLAP